MTNEWWLSGSSYIWSIAIWPTMCQCWYCKSHPAPFHPLGVCDFCKTWGSTWGLGSSIWYVSVQVLQPAPGAKNLITQMLTFDPSIRPTAEVGWVASKNGGNPQIMPFWLDSFRCFTKAMVLGIPNFENLPTSWRGPRVVSRPSDGADESMVEVQGGVLGLKRGGAKLTRGFSA